MRSIAALDILRHHVIQPILAGVRITHREAAPASSTALDRHYERLCLDIQPIFEELGIAA
jgi:hypothetical protein